MLLDTDSYAQLALYQASLLRQKDGGAYSDMGRVRDEFWKWHKMEGGTFPNLTDYDRSRLPYIISNITAQAENDCEFDCVFLKMFIVLAALSKSDSGLEASNALKEVHQQLKELDWKHIYNSHRLWLPALNPSFQAKDGNSMLAHKKHPLTMTTYSWRELMPFQHVLLDENLSPDIIYEMKQAGVDDQLILAAIQD